MEKPILFSSVMINAILSNQKSQTRRIIKPQPESIDHKNHKLIPYNGSVEFLQRNLKCPYGKPGDILYVKETYTIFEPEHCEGMSERFYYKADHHPLNEEWRQEMISHGYPYKWKSGRFMPKYASRLKLKVTNIRVERLQDISKADAAAEGVLPEKWQDHPGYHDYMNPEGWFTNPKWSFCSLWQSIHGEESWKSNPWVWVIEFEKI